MAEYGVTEVFTVKDMRVIVLDRDFEDFRAKKLVVEGSACDFRLNSIRSWVIVDKAVGEKIVAGGKVHFE